MSFLGTEEISRRGEALVSPYNPKRVNCGAYELSIGEEYYETSVEGGKRVVGANEQIQIKPGQLALLITQEEVHIPTDHIAFISIKFSLKKRGLINVSGFHVDPGFSGRLKFSVYNAGSRSFCFDVGQALFLIWFSELVGKSDAYQGSHNGQKHITAGDVEEFQGDVTSPAQLRSELNALSSRVDNLRTIVLAMLAAAVGPLMVFWITRISASFGDMSDRVIFFSVALGPLLGYLVYRCRQRARAT